jgi:hypothetical protein
LGKLKKKKKKKKKSRRATDLAFLALSRLQENQTS